jgi:hypothetical protein
VSTHSLQGESSNLGSSEEVHGTSALDGITDEDREEIDEALEDVAQA